MRLALRRRTPVPHRIDVSFEHETLQRCHTPVVAPGPDPTLSSAMKPSASLQDYVANPVGRYIHGSTYLVWHKSVRLRGLTFWGRPEPEHIASVIRSIDLDVDGEPPASLVDARRVTSIVPAAFDLLADYLRSHHDKLRHRVSAQALLRADGLIGVTVEGFYRIIGHPYPVEVFTDPYRALAWLGAAEHPNVIREVDGLIDEAGDAQSTVRAIRALLAKNPGKRLSLAEVAASLSMSSRSLQRRLRDANSSFLAERNDAQVDFAKYLMTDTNYDIKRVAFEAGFSSPSTFTALFRKVVGQSPTTWRCRISKGAFRQVAGPGR